MNTKCESGLFGSDQVMEEKKHPEMPALKPLQNAGRNKRRGRGPARWLMFLTLVLALGGAVWHIPGLHQYWESLSQIPAVRKSMTSLQERFELVRNDVSRWVAEQEALKENLAALDAKMTKGIDSARRQASALSSKMEERLAARLDERAGQLDRRLTEMDSMRETEGSRVARLEEEMEQLRQSVAHLDDRIMSVDGVPRRLAGLERRVAENESDVEHTASRFEDLRLGSKRFDFELPKRSSRQVAPGIVAQLTRTNIKFQRYDAWLRLVDEGRTLWIRDQSVLEPLTFYDSAGGRAYELVVTRLGANTAIGYWKRSQEGDGQVSLSWTESLHAGESLPR